MGEIYEDIISLLPSGIELTPKNDDRIHRSFPIPSDFKVFWASVESFGGHPSGIVVTDKALIIKATSGGVKIVNKERKAKATESKVKHKKLKSIYQIIMWEHFDVDDFNVIKESKDSYTIEYASTKYPGFSKDCLANIFIEKVSEENRSRKLAYETAVANASLNVMGVDKVIFAAMYGADTSGSGHGIFAEEAGAILDKINMERVEVVGRDNAKSGPDKVVNGSPVQCKYCNSASNSLVGCFRKNASGVMEYRYIDMSGKPMMVEVPKDQYDKAIELMKNRINKGQVPGITDSDAAYTIVKKGKLTHAQAKNLAKAGTIESLTYDAATGVIDCSFTFGLSALTTFAFSLLKTNDPKQAAKDAATTGLQTFGLSLGTQVLSTQIARTGMQKSLIPISDFVVDKVGIKATENLFNAMRKLAGKKPIYGAAAQKSMAKALRVNIISQAITLIVFTIPDTVKLVRQQMSGMEYIKNISSLFASLIGAKAGALLGAAALGSLAFKEDDDENDNNTLGKLIVTAAGAAGGAALGFGAQMAFKLFREEDAIRLSRMFDASVINTCIDYMFNESEIEQFMDFLFKDNESAEALEHAKKILFSSEEQYSLLHGAMDVAAMKVAKTRSVLKKEQEPDDDSLVIALAEIIEASDYEEESQ